MGRSEEGSRTREHLRCPCCGRLAALRSGETLPAAFRGDHNLGGAVQTFTAKGRGAGFEWAARELQQEEAAALEGVVSAAAERLRAEMGAAGAGCREEEDVRAAEVQALRKTVDRLRKALTKRDQMILKQAEQLERLASRLDGR